MPVLEIIRVTPMGKNFNVAYAFILGLMKALEDIFSESSYLLCLFHINRNVEQKATKVFGIETMGLKFSHGLWKRLVESRDEAEYEKWLNQLFFAHSKRPKLVSYLSDTWLVYKERFVHAWTNNILHFGNRTTNR